MLEPVTEVRIQVLMDNYCDVSLPSSPVARRPALGRAAGNSAEHVLAPPLVAEHGLSYWIRFRTGGTAHSLLFDFGFSPDGALRNAKSLGVDLTAAEALVLSHGHFDHFGGLREMAGRLAGELAGRGLPGPGAGRSLPLYTGADAFLRRFVHPRGKARVDIGRLDRAGLGSLGREVREVRKPAEILPGALILADIPRVTPFEKGSPALEVEAGGGPELDTFPGELALVFRVAGAGLVLISACAHAGIINTLRYACQLTGEERVAAVIGGFHLGGASPEAIEQTVASLAELGPRHVVPMHCTGFAAQQAIAARLGEAFIQNTVGTEYMVTAPGPAEAIGR